MGRTRDSLKHQLRTAALASIKDDHSVRAYKRSCDAFAMWAKGEGIRDLKEVNAEVLQRYCDYLQARPENYTAATIHAKMAAPCKAAGVSMKEIRKPKRTASRIIRGRRPTKAGQAERELSDPQYQRLITLQQCVGIRRGELSKLRGDDLISDHGSLYVRVKKGKGGKSTLQYVLPEDRDTVCEIFRGIKPDELVFSADEIPPRANLHGLRAQHAKRCYQYYVEILRDRPDRAEHLRGVLLRRWEKGHADLLHNDPKHYQYARSKFIKSMDDRPVMLRGENKEKAIKLGLPVIYDRLALMATSIMHLSHWRVDVTVINYLIT